MLTQLVREYPHSGRSQWLLGDSFLASGAVSQGLVSYRLAINMLGTHYQLLTEISKRLIEVERYRPAEALLTFAWENEPGFPLAPSLLAAIRAEHGDAPGTERYAAASLALYPDDVIRQHLLAWALAAQGRREEARQARRIADAQGVAGIWHEWMYLAYMRGAEGDSVGVLEAVDSAETRVRLSAGRAALDSAIVADFGLGSLLPGRGEPGRLE